MYFLLNLTALWASFLKIQCVICSDITDASFGTHSEGVLAAFGDFNSDELTDAFVIVNRSSIQIYFAYDKEPFLRPSSLFVCTYTDLIITSVVPGDYDGDAFMDVLLTTMPLSRVEDVHQDVRILWGGEPKFNCNDANTVKVVTIGQPLVIDYNQDMILDLFAIDNNRERSFWLFDKSRSNPYRVPMGYFSQKATKLTHSHAFIDVNGDNSADLLVTTDLEVEIWLGSESPGFKYFKSIQMLIGRPVFGQALFLDVALTGQFSMILPVCFDAECSHSSLFICENLENVDACWRDLFVNFNDDRGGKWRLVPPRNETYLDTMTMRSGDFNMDGYPDILLTLSKENSNDTYIFLLHNQPCDFEQCQFRRTYAVQWDKFAAFGKGNVVATFYDFYMDGILDIIYMRKNATTNIYTMHAFKNELDYDANFIKVIVLTGLTNKHSPKIYGPFYKKNWTYGTNLPGPKISYSTVSPQGNQRTGVCAQLPQSAYFSLQLPYSIFGLDRTPNFVESLMIGLFGHLRTWTHIIPNSQMVVVPKPINKPSQWRAQLFVTPSKLVLNSVLVLTAVLVIILVSVLFLNWRERNDRQDIVEIYENNCVNL